MSANMSAKGKTIDFSKVRGDFPILSIQMRGEPLTYLDNGATTQKPRQVIEIEKSYYEKWNANVHRGAYWLSQEATELYEGVRNKVCSLLGTENTREVIYTRGTTEAINIVARCWGEKFVKEGDRILITRMEHHSNFVPWQVLAKKTGAEFVIIELDDQGRIDLDHFEKEIQKGVKILAFSHISNVLGTINPVKKIAEKAKAQGAVIMLDAAQSAGHQALKISDLGPVDFIGFSSHKMCGPTGVGILWGREELLNQMEPWQYGGDMILQVEDQESQWNELPWKFEAGTPNIAGVIAFGAAIDYLKNIGMDEICKKEMEIAQYALGRMMEISGLTLIGPEDMNQRASIFSFTLDGVHPHDLATFLDTRGIAIRAGHHCAQPLMRHYGIKASSRASFSFYNTKDEVDILALALEDAKKYFEVSK